MNFITLICINKIAVKLHLTTNVSLKAYSKYAKLSENILI